MAEVEIDDVVDVAFQGADIAQQVADGAVAMPRLRLGAIDGFIHREAVAGGVRKPLEDEVESARAGDIMDDAGDGNGPGIDHRVEGAVGMRVENDGVERIAARLNSDAFEDGVAADQFECETIDESFGDRLDGEGIISVADLMQRAIDSRDGNTEAVRIDSGQFGNVIRRRTRCIVAMVRVGRVQNITNSVCCLFLHRSSDGEERKFQVTEDSHGI